MAEAFRMGGVAQSLDELAVASALDRIAEDVRGGGAKSVLLIPPDITRLDSMAGELAAGLYERLVRSGVRVRLMPALGTHRPMTADQNRRMFGEAVLSEHILAHRWRDDLVELGELDAAWVDELSGGRLSAAGVAAPMKVAVNRELIHGGHDVVISLGQVVPHEVVGLANYSKNILIGVGGPGTIHLSHFLGAVCGMESIMGRLDTPVRRALDTGFERFVTPRVDVRFVFTAIESLVSGLKLRGLFYGKERRTFEEAAELSQRVNLTRLGRPVDRCVVYLEPEEFASTWLGNKAVYRTRLAMADGGTLIVLAPGIETFGEDEAIDGLIRRFGYRGTPATLKAVKDHQALRDNLSAAAHLIHGSSEGRFRIVYATGPGVTKAQVESVGYEHADLETVRSELGLEDLTPGWRTLADGGEAYVIDKPALGLWSV
ncbi:MAG: lactate racemase domain-containing protein [Phycisphaeraceae bacterium]